MLERSVMGWPLVPFTIGGPAKGMWGDSEQGVDWEPPVYVPILVLGLGLCQKVRTLFLNSTPTPRSQGTGFPRSCVSDRWGKVRGHVLGDPSHPVFSPVPSYIYGWY